MQRARRARRRRHADARRAAAGASDVAADVVDRPVRLGGVELDAPSCSSRAPPMARPMAERSNGRSNSPVMRPRDSTTTRLDTARTSSSSAPIHTTAAPSAAASSTRSATVAAAPGSRPRVGWQLMTTSGGAVQLAGQHELLGVAARQAAHRRARSGRAHVPRRQAGRHRPLAGCGAGAASGCRDRARGCRPGSSGARGRCGSGRTGCRRCAGGSARGASRAGRRRRRATTVPASGASTPGEHAPPARPGRCRRRRRRRAPRRRAREVDVAAAPRPTRRATLEADRGIGGHRGRARGGGPRRQLAPDHGVGQRGDGVVGDGGVGQHDRAVAQHRHPVAALDDLAPAGG